ncbi:E3 ubiquitin-protein ligase RNF4-like [Acanthaster planci]|uniref:E3 ubiquitin-protein ligase RNF4-like n=1 Tax=Acanthaster planci TaxID=133434 RepID=A0A8B7XJ64_ACAPL|nr:E3 ubiquitin-protein ligase RNF4-like [Acanthaster planci]XP_022080845.1 E3 ubiquitin-protein ligase RNF4-like [Acanthaster planci]
MAQRRRRNSSDDVLIISDDPSPTFVDLTQESPAGASSSNTNQTSQAAHFFSSSNYETVDLTCGDTSPVMLDPVIVPPSSRRRRSRRLQSAARRHSPYSTNNDITIESDEENDVQVLSPVDVNNALPWPELSSEVATPPDMIGTPGRKQVKCPVCMDNETQIRANGLQLNSTICGHIFCNRCIRRAVQSQHRCPTCRTKLTMRQIHPIFL